MPPAVLIIEDEPAIADTLLYALATEGFRPHWCATGREGREALDREPFALVILDVGLPDMSGFTLCQEIRLRSPVPILFLTARNNEIDRVVGLEMGGDDYVAKPFSPREVAARVRAILRRGPPVAALTGATTTATAPDAAGSSAPRSSPPCPLRDASPAAETQTPSVPSSGRARQRFAVDEARFQIRYLNTPLDLTRIEFRLLKVLLARPGRVFSREQLLTAAWDEPEASLDRTVDAHIKTIRAKLRAVTSGTDPIQTHRGLGYSLREAEE